MKTDRPETLPAVSCDSALRIYFLVLILTLVMILSGGCQSINKVNNETVPKIGDQIGDQIKGKISETINGINGGNTANSKSNPCPAIDWFEAGRSDGAIGLSPIDKIKEYRTRCEGTAEVVDEVLYINGHNAGVIDYCTPTVGLESGRGGLPYEGICPTHLEKRFRSAYDVGRRIYDLEAENSELAGRIYDLNRSLSPSSSNDSVRGQIEQLKARRAILDSKIHNLETLATSGKKSF